MSCHFARAFRLYYVFVGYGSRLVFSDVLTDAGFGC